MVRDAVGIGVDAGFCVDAAWLGSLGGRWLRRLPVVLLRHSMAEGRNGAVSSQKRRKKERTVKVEEKRRLSKLIAHGVTRWYANVINLLVTQHQRLRESAMA